MITTPRIVCGPNTIDIIKNRLYVNGEKVCDAEVKDMQHSQYGRGQPYFWIKDEPEHYWIDNAEDDPSEWRSDRNRYDANKKPLFLAGVIKRPKALVVNGDLQGESQTAKQRPKGRRQKA